MQALSKLFLIVAMTVLAGAAVAQGTVVPFGSISADRTAPVEISADSLSVDQADGAAIFEGNVVVVQGGLQLNAGMIRVEYATEETDAGSGISRLVASGGVSFLSASEKAEADAAIYDLIANTVTLEGSVLLAQGNKALSAEKAVIEIGSGRAALSGRVRTILQAGGN